LAATVTFAYINIWKQLAACGAPVAGSGRSLLIVSQYRGRAKVRCEENTELLYLV